jgi:hypothetical protein
MNCQRLRDSFTDALAGTLPATEAAAIQAHLAGCAECRREWAALQETLLTLDRLPAAEPGPRLRKRFDAMLAEAKREAAAPAPAAEPFGPAWSRLDAFFAMLLPARPALQGALAVAVLAVGFVLGGRLARPPSPVAPATDPALSAEIAALRSQVESMAQIVSTSLIQPSANARLEGVLAAAESGEADEVALARLLHALAFDPSTNIRLRALEELYVHARLDPVRAGVLAALPRERSPLVQVAMIDFLAAVGDPAAAPVFADLARTASVNEVVRNAAQTALAML